MNRKDWITILASSVTTIFVCIITIWSNININSKINETNLLISDTTSKTTFSINNQEQLESRFRYIADLMVENIGTNNSDMIIDFANLLIQDLKRRMQERHKNYRICLIHLFWKIIYIGVIRQIIFIDLLQTVFQKSNQFVNKA